MPALKIILRIGESAGNALKTRVFGDGAIKLRSADWRSVAGFLGGLSKRCVIGAQRWSFKALRSRNCE